MMRFWKSWIVVLLVAPVGLFGGDVGAAPNLHSEARSRQGARLMVTSPTGGAVVFPGDALPIAWTKTTSETVVEVMVYTSNADGVRQQRVRDLTPAGTSFPASGGTLSWTVPEGIERGRYVVTVKCGLDLATSAPFTIAEHEHVIGAPQLGGTGVVSRVDVSQRGAQGIAEIGGREYEWGRAQCPALVGGLAGGLAAMATIRAEVEPRFRTVTLRGATVQTCLEGLRVVAPAEAAPLGELGQEVGTPVDLRRPGK